MSDKVFQIVCPHCRTVIWVDGESRSLIKSEKAARKKESLDDLLAKEKEKHDGLASKFEATAALAQEKRRKAQDAFEHALEKGPKDGEKPDDQ